MSYEQRPYQTHGAQNQSYQVGTFPPYSSAENFSQTQPCVTASSVFYSSGEERQLPLVLTGHAVQYSNTDYQYQPVAWNGDHHRAATEHAAYSVYEANQNYACWNEPCRKGNFVQYVPSVNTYTFSSVMPTTPDVSHPPFASLRHKHQVEEIDPTTLLTSHDEKLRANQVCHVCGRTFVYQLNFAKHMTAAGCCQPPCKKSRKEPEIDTIETFKNNTLPRASRAKKVSRSNSTKSRKRPIIPPSLNNRQPEFLPNSEVTSGSQQTSQTTATPTNEEIEILQVIQPRPIHATVSSETASPTPYYAPQNVMFCHFCNLQLSTPNLYQRHCLAHALVIQLTRCLELSLPTFSQPNNETASGSSNSTSAVLNNWLTDQIRVNFNDQNWLRLSVMEVEQVLGNSNMDVDIRQRHGIQDDTEFQNVVDLLINQDLNLSPRNECSEVQGGPYFFPEESSLVSESSESPGSFTFVQGHQSPIESPSSIPDTLSIVSVNSDLLPTSPVYQASGNQMEAGCSTSIYPDTPFLDLNQSLESFNLLVTDLDTVEKQMASLLNTYESISSECGENFTQPELTFQNVFVDDSLDIFPVRNKTPPPESVECSFTPEVNLDVNLTSCKMTPLSGEVDLLTYRLDESDQSRPI